MRTHRSKTLHAFRLRPLAACLAFALSADVFAGAVFAERGNVSQASLPAHKASAVKQNSDHPTAPQTRTVQNCSDGAPDSLRDIITNPNSPNHAQSGDTVDLSQLPMLCAATQSTITLSSGEIAIAQDSLTLQGPGADQGVVTISGGGASRVFEHTGGGMLSIEDLTIANGYYHAASNAYGGCIWTNAQGTESLYLRNTVVTACTAMSDTGKARGGGIHSRQVTLVLSNVSGNKALAPMGRGYGGGIHSNTIFAKYSAISDNVAGDGVTFGGLGGGAYVPGGISMFASTVDHNTASYGGGMVFRNATTIIDSTVSGNTAHQSAAALWSRGSDSLAISNSTIAFNQADIPSSLVGAVHFEGSSGSSLLTLQSSIIANNTASGPSDLSLNPGNLAGADNLVMASTVFDPNVITVISDPKLGPLQLNGGLTRTHALLPGSPAIGVGNHTAMPPGFTNDQRGSGYPRTTGTGANITTDIGAFEFDTIFSGHFDSN